MGVVSGVVASGQPRRDSNRTEIKKRTQIATESLDELEFLEKHIEEDQVRIKESICR